MPGEARRPAWLLPALLALAWTGGLFLLQARIDFNPADEGYQWYGAIATAHGEVPLRDFASYEPGRYLWSAAWSKLFGDGLVALRLSTSIFAAVGLFFGLLAARRALRTGWGLALAGGVLALWVLPRHKAFEAAWTMAAVWFAVRLLERPTPKRHLAAGVFVGLSSFLGKNHLLYCGVAFFLLIVYERLWIERRETAASGLGIRILSAGAGFAVGLLPIASMGLFVPGFFAAYRDSFLFFLHQGRTNFPLPVPWPWRPAASGQVVSGLGELARIAVGCGFVLLPLFALTFAWFALTAGRENVERRRLLLAAGFVGSLYLHHAFARADPFHLAQSVHPALLGLMALPAALATRQRAARFATAALIAFLTLFAAVPLSPLFLALRSSGPDRFTNASIAGDTIRISDRASRLYAAISWEVGHRVPPDEPLFIGPHMPGLYPLLGRKSPVWDIYPIWPAVGTGDERMLRELAAVRWALLDDYVLDDRPELGFEFTHPRSAATLRDSFERVPTPALPKKLRLLRRRDGG